MYNLTPEQWELVAKNSKLTYYTVNKTLKGSIPTIMREEAEEVGFNALCYAAKSFNEDRSKFSTFAIFCIRRKIWNWFKQFRKKLDYKAVFNEDFQSDESKGDGTQLQLEAREENTFCSKAFVLINTYIKKLSEFHQNIVNSYYGLNGKPKQIAEEIGKELNMSYKMVYYHKDAAVSQLKKLMKDEDIQVDSINDLLSATENCQ